MIQITLNFLVILFVLSFLGCSSHYKKRQQQRDKVAATSGLFCEFVSGDEFTDVDVEVNLRMAKKCDLEKPLTMTNYRNSSDNFGLVYCCQIAKGKIEKTKTDELAPMTPVVGDGLSAKPTSPTTKKRSTKKSKAKTDKPASSTSSPSTATDASGAASGTTGPTVESSSTPPTPSESPATTTPPAETGTTAPGGQ